MKKVLVITMLLLISTAYAQVGKVCYMPSYVQETKNITSADISHRALASQNYKSNEIVSNEILSLSEGKAIVNKLVTDPDGMQVRRDVINLIKTDSGSITVFFVQKTQKWAVNFHKETFISFGLGCQVYFLVF